MYQSMFLSSRDYETVPGIMKTLTCRVPLNKLIKTYCRGAESEMAPYSLHRALLLTRADRALDDSTEVVQIESPTPKKLFKKTVKSPN